MKLILSKPQRPKVPKLPLHCPLIVGGVLQVPLFRYASSLSTFSLCYSTIGSVSLFSMRLHYCFDKRLKAMLSLIIICFLDLFLKHKQNLFG